MGADEKIKELVDESIYDRQEIEELVERVIDVHEERLPDHFSNEQVREKTVNTVSQYIDRARRGEEKIDRGKLGQKIKNNYDEDIDRWQEKCQNDECDYIGKLDSPGGFSRGKICPQCLTGKLRIEPYEPNQSLL